MLAMLLLLVGLSLAETPSAELLRADASEAHQGLARSKRLESMTFLKELLAKDKLKGAQRAEVELRLGQLYFEEGAASGAPEYLAKAEGVLQGFTQAYPAHTRHDEALLTLGRSLALQGRSDEAEATLSELIRTWPDSHHVPAAYVLLGDLHLGRQGSEVKALLLYQKASQFTRDRWRAYALYGLARASRRVGDEAKARRSFEELQALLADPKAVLPEVSVPLQRWVDAEVAAGFPEAEAFGPEAAVVAPPAAPPAAPPKAPEPPPGGIESWEDAAGMGSGD